jgi:hypothetical protein
MSSFPAKSVEKEEKPWVRLSEDETSTLRGSEFRTVLLLRRYAGCSTDR